MIQKRSHLREIMQSFIYFNVSEYCSFSPPSPGNDRLGTGQESEGRVI